MHQRDWLYFVACVMVAGCSLTGIVNEKESEARRRMVAADTLERARSFKEATIEYTRIAEQFSSTSVYPAAVRKAGILYSMPSNPLMNDSASAYWLGIYATMANSLEEKQIIGMYLTTIERARMLRDSLSMKTAIIDSLATTVRRQSSELTSRGKRIQDLEAQLQKASEELLKLKEIDLRISKSRGKNNP